MESEEAELARLIAEMNEGQDNLCGPSDFSWLYGIESGEFIKIGIARDIAGRMDGLQIGNPIRLRIVMRRWVPETRWIERQMHKILRDHSVGGEWFKITQEQARAAFKVAMRDLIAHRREEGARLQECYRMGEEKARLQDVRRVKLQEKNEKERRRVEMVLTNRLRLRPGYRDRGGIWAASPKL